MKLLATLTRGYREEAGDDDDDADVAAASPRGSIPVSTSCCVILNPLVAAGDDIGGEPEPEPNNADDIWAVAM